MSESDTEVEQEEQTEFNPEDAPSEEELEQAIEDAEMDADAGGFMDFMAGGGVKQILLAETFQDPETGHSYSQADLVADVINVMRMDTKQMAALHNIDIEVNKMSPERAAELLDDIATKDGLGIIQVFEQIEDQRDLILQQKMDEETHERYMDAKRQMLYSYGGD